MNPMTAFYVSDLDGTLLNCEGELSAPSRQILTDLLEKGLPFTVASARSVVSIREVLGNLPLSLPIIEFNGAFISDLKTGRHQVVNRIDPPIVEDVLKTVLDHGLLPFVSAFDGERDQVYYTRSLNAGMDVYLKDRRDNNDPRLQEVPTWEKAVAQNVVCFNVIAQADRLDPLEKDIRKKHGSRIETHCYEDIYAKGWYWLTIHDHRATKDQGIQVLQERHGLKDRELVVFGDQVNDVRMFKLAHRGIAVENATPELKKLAHRVIGSHHKDSVARFIEEDWKKLSPWRDAGFTLRKAVLEDIPILEELIGESARGLGLPDYSPEQVEAALGTAWGVDTELIQDGTFFAAESAGKIIACGGWSRRKTLFGADGQAGRQSESLDPARDSVRIRAFFVHPGWARRGIGKALLEKCELEAKAWGFQSAELVATLPGQRLYRAFGYVGEKRVTYPLKDGLTIDFIPMRKEKL